MPQLRIADLLAASPADPAAHLDNARVEKLAASHKPLPPVVVFDTETGLLLVDGYHRVAAARRRRASPARTSRAHAAEGRRG